MPMPPYPRPVDRGKGRGPNLGRRDGRGHSDNMGGGDFQFQPRAQQPGRGRGLDRDWGPTQGGSGAPAGRDPLHGRGGAGTAQQQSSRPIGTQSQHQYVPIPTNGKVHTGAERDQQQPDQGALKKKRSFYVRCKSSGHVNENCKTNLDCIICNKVNTHMSAKCPILKMQLETLYPSPTGLVTVTGGNITAEMVQRRWLRQNSPVSQEQNGSGRL